MFSNEGVAPTNAVVLLVDDHSAVRGLIRLALENRGYTVLSATDGQQALELAQQFEGPIHLLLSDIDMPHLDGIQLAKHIQEQRPETKLLYMSGSADFKDLPVLRKPFALEALERAVTEILDDAAPPKGASGSEG
jgi:two-component system, cell cycle sensor histidine kinase and response regulator CckA